MTLPGRPRVARPASPGLNLAKTFAQAMTLWFIFYGWLPVLIARAEELHAPALRCVPSAPAVAAATGVFVVAGAAALWTGAILALRGEGTPLPLDTARKLVVAGLYRHVRNPMAALSFLQGQATAVIHGSPAVALYVLVGMFIWQYLARPWEERDLAERFGGEYERYRANVRCWVPRLEPYEPEAAVSPGARTPPPRDDPVRSSP